MATNNDSSGNGTTSKTARVKALAAEVAEALEMRRRDPDDASTEYHRFGYCDQTLEESGIESLSDLARAAGGNYGIGPTISLLALGMAAEMAEVLGLVRLFLEDMADDDESDPDSE
jgi:hypothetical protein